MDDIDKIQREKTFVSLPATLLLQFERALGKAGAYHFVESLNQDQVDAIVRTAMKNEWIIFNGDWHDG